MATPAQSHSRSLPIPVLQWPVAIKGAIKTKISQAARDAQQQQREARGAAGAGTGDAASSVEARLEGRQRPNASEAVKSLLIMDALSAENCFNYYRSWF